MRDLVGAKAWFLVALLNAGLGACASGPRGPVSSRTLVELELADALLQQAKESPALASPSIPSWACLEGAAVPPLEAPAIDLQRVLHDSESAPRLQALAMLYLASRIDPQDLSLLESFSDRSESVGWLPLCGASGAWREVALQDVALVALGRVTLARHADIDAYEAFIESAGELAASFDYHAKVLALPESEELRRARLKRIEAVAPGLSLRLALALSDGQFGLDTKLLIEGLRAWKSAAALWEVVAEPGTLPEHRSVPHYLRFATFVLEHGRAILAPERPERLLSFWRSRRLDAHPQLAQQLARSSALANPEHRLEIIRAALDQKGVRDHGLILEVFYQHHPRQALKIAPIAAAPPRAQQLALKGLMLGLNALRSPERTEVVAQALGALKTRDVKVIAAASRVALEVGAVIPSACADAGQLSAGFAERCLLGAQRWLRTKAPRADRPPPRAPGRGS